ncbi:MAG: transcription elongation factor GreA [Clostridia bacterium]|jgi:transcription elongation factor GreA|nr:transcription elongation factor GreA [Clostridia bacterium]MBQ1933967.1 transcription elongation factor GreA [Clostridia bacterium]MBQ5809586.1 transcription elongation factor GreA [Clostridia bacterium]MBR0327579.1 transcription elongation factor GreA [Clostridia bacterium]
MAAKQLFNTEAGLRALKEELDYLKNTKRNEVKENLAIARSFGDLSENSEYDEAKNEQSKVEGRISELEEIILHTVVVEESALDHSAIHLGSTVILREIATGKEKKYAIVGSNEANPLEGRISDRSPIGSAILGKKAGEEVTVSAPKGDKKYVIVEVTRTVKE